MENLDTEYVLLCVLRPAPLLYLYHVQYYSLFLSFQLNGVVAHDNLVLIKMRPDEHGRFGFNVKVTVQPEAHWAPPGHTPVFILFLVCLFQGGADQKMPIIVSRVAPGTSVSPVYTLHVQLYLVHTLKHHSETSGFTSNAHILTLCPQADLCVPRLNEGDQVVLINGRDISEHTHDQVVMFIKASCESHSGELILLVRPNGER